MEPADTCQDKRAPTTHQSIVLLKPGMEEIAVIMAQSTGELHYQMLSYRVYWRSPLSHLYVTARSWEHMSADQIMDETDSDSEKDMQKELREAMGSLNTMQQKRYLFDSLKSISWF